MIFYFYSIIKIIVLSYCEMFRKIKTEKSFNDFLVKLQKLRDAEGDSEIIVLIHANWCSYCKMFKPIWEKYKKENSKSKIIYELEYEFYNQLIEDETFREMAVVKMFQKKLEGFPTTMKITMSKGKGKKSKSVIKMEAISGIYKYKE